MLFRSDDDRRSQPLAAMIFDLTPAEHPRALGDGIGDLRGDHVGLLAENEGTDGALMDVGPVRLDTLRFLDEASHEGFKDFTIDVDPLNALASLAGRQTGRAQSDVGGALKIGTRRYDEWIVAAELEKRRNEVTGGIGGDESARPHAAREADHINRKSTRLNSSHVSESRMPSSA